MKRLKLLQFHLLPFVLFNLVCALLIYVNCVGRIPEYERQNMEFLPGLYPIEKAEHCYGWPWMLYIQNSKRSFDYSEAFGIVRRNGWHLDGLIADVLVGMAISLTFLFVSELIYRRLTSSKS